MHSHAERGNEIAMNRCIHSHADPGRVGTFSVPTRRSWHNACADKGALRALYAFPRGAWERGGVEHKVLPTEILL